MVVGSVLSYKADCLGPLAYILASLGLPKEKRTLISDKPNPVRAVYSATVVLGNTAMMPQQTDPERATGCVDNGSVHEVGVHLKEEEGDEVEVTWTLEEEAVALRKLDWNLIPL